MPPVQPPFKPGGCRQLIDPDGPSHPLFLPCNRPLARPYLISISRDGVSSPYAVTSCCCSSVTGGLHRSRGFTLCARRARMQPNRRPHAALVSIQYALSHLPGQFMSRLCSLTHRFTGKPDSGWVSVWHSSWVITVHEQPSAGLAARQGCAANLSHQGVQGRELDASMTGNPETPVLPRAYPMNERHAPIPSALLTKVGAMSVA